MNIGDKVRIEVQADERAACRKRQHGQIGTVARTSGQWGSEEICYVQFPRETAAVYKSDTRLI